MARGKLTLAALRRLRLQEGDVILVRDVETLEQFRRLIDGGRLQSLRVDNPIVYAPGSMHRISREYLEKLIAGKR